jgi:fibro-slime domain-containing protein
MFRLFHSSRDRFLHVCSVVSALALCVACGSSKDPSAAASRACTPGEQRACACPGGDLGIQICNADGSALGECMGCSSSATGGATSTIAISAPGGASSSSADTAPSGGDSAAGGGAATGGLSSTTTTTEPTANTNTGGASSAGGASPVGGNVNTVIDTSAGGSATTGGESPMGGTAPGGGTTGEPQTLIGGTPAAGGASLGGMLSTGGAAIASTCGNGIVEGTEGCDPAVRDYDLGDGCTPTCEAEPACPTAGGACTTTCGDGYMLGSETCDDGNAVSGDGCSSDCQIENGFTCTPAPVAGMVQVPLVVRDFNEGGDFEKGSSFALDLDYANQGLIQPLLDPTTLKPALLSTTGTYNGTAGQDSGIASAASFAQWFNEKATPAGNKYHASLATTLNLYLAGSNPVTYVNRYGNNGDGLTDAQYQVSYLSNSYYCGEVGKEDHDAAGNAIPCTYCPLDEDTSTPQCDPAPASTHCSTNPPLYCIQEDGRYWYGVYEPLYVDGNPLFFPADGVSQPWSPNTYALISGNYDELWPQDPVAGRTHNFSFSTEVRFWFKYDASQSYTLSFTGDDDSWVFVNRHLALDMGGIHLPVQGVLVIENGQTSATVSNTLPTDSIRNLKSTPDLGTFEDGKLYEVAVFQVERQTQGSSYGLSVTPNFIATPSACQRTP